MRRMKKKLARLNINNTDQGQNWPKWSLVLRTRTVTPKNAVSFLP